MRPAHFMRLLGIMVVVCSSAVLAFAGDTVIEEIIVRVNNQIITRSDLDHAIELMKNSPNPNPGSSEKDVLRDLIDQKLLLEKGDELGITADTELVKKLDELRKSMGLKDIDELPQAAAAQGVNFDEYKQNMRNSIITQQVIQHEVGGHIIITPEEEQDWYKKHEQELSRPEQVRLSEILLKTQDDKGNDLPADQIAAAQKRAQDALALIKSDKSSFKETALRYSDGPSASQGGDLGYFKRGTLAKELEDRVFAMHTGDITDVIRTKQGFVILKLDEHVEAGVPPFKTVEGKINEQLYFQKLEPALRTYLSKLREDAFIDIKPGFVDTGASQNQTKPVLTTTAAPTNEKKKKKKKFLLF